MSQLPRSVAESIMYAAEQGLDVVYPSERELVVDIDDAESETRFYSVLSVLPNHGYDLTVVKNDFSKSGPPKKHIYLSSKTPLNKYEHVALASILGGDPLWCINALSRINAGEEKPFVIFEKKTDDAGTFVYVKQCIACHEAKHVTVSRAGYDKWQAGVLIQRALPELSAGDRELFISGICGPCFDRMFE